MTLTGDDNQRMADAAYAKAADVCQYCLKVHAEAAVHENFEDSRGFSLFDLPMWAEPSPVPVNWDTITPETSYAEANAYLIGVAADYLRNGDVVCECE